MADRRVMARFDLADGTVTHWCHTRRGLLVFTANETFLVRRPSRLDRIRRFFGVGR